MGAATCCEPGDLNDRGEALGTIGTRGYGGAARYDVATGRLLDSLPSPYRLLNNRGDLVGSIQSDWVNYSSTAMFARGFALPPLPAGAPARFCDTHQRYTHTTPLSLDDSANVLASHCGNVAYLTAAPGGSVWLDRALGRAVAARLSPQGGVVAALDSVGRVYVWRAATRRAERVQLVGGAWRVDSLGAVNAAGVIAAHGVNAATGRAAALLLTPTAR
jgi:hypothetical protein